MTRLRFALAVSLLVFLTACSRDPKEVAKRYVETGNKYYDKGKYKEASIMYRRALQRDMRNAQAHYRLGLTEVKTGEVINALRSLQRASELDPNNTDALAKLGELYLVIYASNPVTFKSQLSELNDVAKKLLAKDPQSYDGLRLSGLVDMLNKDYPAAIEKFKHANQIKP